VAGPGSIRWSGLYAWKLEADDRAEESLPICFWFGCEQTGKIIHGQKFALQTQHKFNKQLGAKLSGPPGELSASVGSELSETLTYEFTAGFEWTYSAKPCEYCIPRVHFPNARIRLYSKRLLNLPLLVTRRTILDPGEPSVIRAHCRRATEEECGGCSENPIKTVSNPVLQVVLGGHSTHLERVVFASRTPIGNDRLSVAAGGLLGTPEEERQARPPDIVGLNNEVRSITTSELNLFEIDDIDRALGAVRIQEGPNEFTVIAQNPPSERGMLTDLAVELRRENGEAVTRGEATVGTVEDHQVGLVVIRVNVPPVESASGELTLSLSSPTGKFGEWPATIVRQ
jgi:hypothetical protein